MCVSHLIAKNPLQVGLVDDTTLQQRRRQAVNLVSVLPHQAQGALVLLGQDALSKY